MPAFAPLPERAAWRHHTARDASEVLHTATSGDGVVLSGVSAGVEDDVAFALAYEIVVDAAWGTRTTVVRSLVPGGGEVRLVRDGSQWAVDGVLRPDLDGLLDVDLECSAVTNTLPVHREPLTTRTAAPAVYVRLDLEVRRLEQTYGPAVALDGGGWAVAYTAPEFGADFALTYDATGLVVDYPGLATRLQVDA